MIERVKVAFPEDEYRALVAAAEDDLRPVPDEVRFLVREALILRRFLQVPPERQARMLQMAKV